MRAGTRWCVLSLGAMLTLLSGCGLDIMVTADPAAARAGQNTNFTAMVRNETQCEVFNAELLVATFIPPGAIPGGANFCDLIRTIGLGGIDELQSTLGQVFSPTQVALAVQHAEDRFFGASVDGGGQAGPVCVANDSGGGQGFDPGGSIRFDCDLGAIDPSDKVTVDFSAVAPSSGQFRTIAVAFGDVPTDENCAPVPTGMGSVVGCFDSIGTRPAPAMSFAGLAMTALAVVGTGTVMIRRRSR